MRETKRKINVSFKNKENAIEFMNILSKKMGSGDIIANLRDNKVGIRIYGTSEDHNRLLTKIASLKMEVGKHGN